jgi:hypothetical protein
VGLAVTLAAEVTGAASVTGAAVATSVWCSFGNSAGFGSPRRGENTQKR